MATATLNREYALRLCGVGAIMVALAAWSVYDGAVAWPRANADLAAVRPDLLARCEQGLAPERWLAASSPDAPDAFPLQDVYAAHGRQVPRRLVQELRAITRPEGDDREARMARARAAADLFKKSLHSPAKLRGQYVQAAVTFLLGLLAFGAVLRKRGKVYEADAAGLRGSGFGVSLAWDDLQSADWSKWAEKGIVTLVGKDGRRFVLDGWHFAGLKAVAAEIEKRFPRTA